MSIQTVPNSGPLKNDQIDELRSKGFIAMDRQNIKLPADMVAYIRYLENRYIERIKDFGETTLTELWALRCQDD